jgi:hypothetical protein
VFFSNPISGLDEIKEKSQKEKNLPLGEVLEKY